MKLIAIGMLVMIAFVAAPIGVVGEAAAVECERYDLGDMYLDTCDAVCAVGDRMGWHCVD